MPLVPSKFTQARLATSPKGPRRLLFALLATRRFAMVCSRCASRARSSFAGGRCQSLDLSTSVVAHCSLIYQVFDGKELQQIFKLKELPLSEAAVEKVPTPDSVIFRCAEYFRASRCSRPGCILPFLRALTPSPTISWRSVWPPLSPFLYVLDILLSLAGRVVCHQGWSGAD